MFYYILSADMISEFEKCCFRILKCIKLLPNWFFLVFLGLMYLVIIWEEERGNVSRFFLFRLWCNLKTGSTTYNGFCHGSIYGILKPHIFLKWIINDSPPTTPILPLNISGSWNCFCHLGTAYHPKKWICKPVWSQHGLLLFLSLLGSE